MLLKEDKKEARGTGEIGPHPAVGEPGRHARSSAELPGSRTKEQTRQNEEERET